MEIEFHQIDLRYEHLRKRNPPRERHLVASLAEQGQLLPVVIVKPQDRFVLIDGYKRVRALRRLMHDTVRATLWEILEPEALLLERRMRSGESDGPLEEGWLLGELKDRFGWGLPELARRFDRTPSWVSRRLSLVRDLPLSVQDQVRSGALAPHTAMKVLVPLARANREECLKLSEAIAGAKLTTREAGELYTGWLEGTEDARELALKDPALFLKVREEARREPEKPPARLFLDDLSALGGIARRAGRRLRDLEISPPEREEIALAIAQARADCGVLFKRWEKEESDARSKQANSHP